MSEHLAFVWLLEQLTFLCMLEQLTFLWLLEQSTFVCMLGNECYSSRDLMSATTFMSAVV